MKNEKLLVSKSSVDSVREVLTDARADHASEYINGYGDGVAYTLKVLGLMEGGEKPMEELKLTENPLESLQTTIAFSCRDWATERRDAWVYGIVLGWDDNCFNEFEKKFGWDKEVFNRLKRLHSKFEGASRHAAPATAPQTKEQQEADKLIRLLIKGEDVNPCEWCRQPDKGGEKCKGCYLYEDSDEFPSKFTAFSSKPNDTQKSENPPLTLKQLWQMGNGPIWIVNSETEVCIGCHVLSRYIKDEYNGYCSRFIFTDGRVQYEIDYSKTWLAYARKPES